MGPAGCHATTTRNTHTHFSFSLVRDKYVGTDLSWAPQDLVQHRLQQFKDLTHSLKIFYSAWDVVPTPDVAQGLCVAVCCSVLQCVACPMRVCKVCVLQLQCVLQL